MTLKNKIQRATPTIVQSLVVYIIGRGMRMAEQQQNGETKMKWTDEMIDELVEYLTSLEEAGFMPSEIEEARHRYVASVEEAGDAF